MMDSEHGIVPAQDDWTSDIEWPEVDLAYGPDLDFAGAVRKAKSAKRLKSAMVKGVYRGMGRYIAELSTLASVEHGGIAKFAKAIGMNYVTLKTHRSRYLDSGQKRRYVKKVTPATIPEVIEQPVEEAEVVDDKPPAFTDMFDGSTRTATELEVVEPPEPVGHDMIAQVCSSDRSKELDAITAEVFRILDRHGLAERLSRISVEWTDGESGTWINGRS